MQMNPSKKEQHEQRRWWRWWWFSLEHLKKKNWLFYYFSCYRTQPTRRPLFCLVSFTSFCFCLCIFICTKLNIYFLFSSLAKKNSNICAGELLGALLKSHHKKNSSKIYYGNGNQLFIDWRQKKYCLLAKVLDKVMDHIHTVSPTTTVNVNHANNWCYSFYTSSSKYHTRPTDPSLLKKISIILHYKIAKQAFVHYSSLKYPLYNDANKYRVKN